MHIGLFYIQCMKYEIEAWDYVGYEWNEKKKSRGRDIKTGQESLVVRFSGDEGNWADLKILMSDRMSGSDDLREVLLCRLT